MTQLLQKAFDQASRLPAADQDALARRLLKDLRDDERWEVAFASSAGPLSRLAAEARAEHASGRTKKLEAGSL
jgi:hypothetical protein